MVDRVALVLVWRLWIEVVTDSSPDLIYIRIYNLHGTVS